MSRTAEQSRRLHALIGKIYPKNVFDEMKAQHAFEVSDGRTSKTSELTFQECTKLIKELQDTYARLDKERNKTTPAKRKMFALMKSIGWDYERLSKFIIDQTSGKKNHSNQLNDAEVNSMVSVMEKIELHKTKRS